MESDSAFIDEKIEELGDWRGKMLAKVREIIHEADLLKSMQAQNEPVAQKGKVA